MTPPNRLEMIQKIIAQTPTDPFPYYGLALELKGLGRSDDALRAFADLESKFAGYVPQYLMHATLLVEMGRAADAKSVLERGIAIGQKSGAGHAVGEMQQLLDSIAV